MSPTDKERPADETKVTSRDGELSDRELERVTGGLALEPTVPPIGAIDPGKLGPS